MEFLEFYSIFILDVVVLINDMGIVWDFIKYVIFLCEMLICVDDMGIIWNCVKYIVFLYRRVMNYMVLVWG